MDSTTSTAKLINWFPRFLPTYSFLHSIFNIKNVERYASNEDLPKPESPYSFDISGGDLLCMGLTTILYFMGVFILEHRITKQKYNQNDIDYKAPEKIDIDVQNEEQRVSNSLNNNDFTLKVDKLRKVYSSKNKKGESVIAVNRLSVGVKNGECFVLLGVNGAGKTTSFKMLTGELQPTSGEAFIQGHSVSKDINQVRKVIGYCPQYDALLENLTAKEHLRLYASIKGIPGDKIQFLIEKLLIELNLKQYENIPAGTYSGGNKRKLSVAIALIGNPPAIFLDEPSNGIDPEARRFMWNVLSRISNEQKHSSIILTTHSMEEAEALGTKIGIFVNGNMKTLGSAQSIKSKYGGGFEIEIKLAIPTKEEVTNFVTDTIGRQCFEILDKNEIEQILEKMKMGDLVDQIKPDGSGSSFYAILESKNKVEMQLLADWIMIEAKGQKIKVRRGR